MHGYGAGVVPFRRSPSAIHRFRRALHRKQAPGDVGRYAVSARFRAVFRPE